jgi:glycosyltransferase involved in cell wall biosynthesis
MKILFDHQTFVYQRFGGISRYFTELVSCLNKTKTGSATISALLTDNVYLLASENKKAFSILNGRFLGSMTLYNTVNRFVTKWKIRNAKYDIFHPTYYDTYFLKNIGDKPFVVTVYDMIHELYPNKWENQTAISYNKSVLIKKASHIIAISEHTKQDLLYFYPEIPSARISVIWLGNSSSIQNTTIKKNSHSFAKPYFLFVGKRGEYKNFNLLVTQIAGYLKYNEIDLIAAGGGSFTEEETELIKKLDVETSIHVIPFVSDSGLAELYSNAIAFIFPSAYEGFGIPILEAFQSKCPVILNNASCFPEIAGNAALYFNEENDKSIIGALETVRNNIQARNELIEKGNERLKLFTWEIAAQKTMEVYISVKKQHDR